ncbi:MULTISPECIES: hypothetical protein [Stenotrophomonas]|uniref:hypothetical protein n=1 Tax=Stenotrophomonas TaxID=40323 RepID=UPI000872297F|nr:MULTISPECIES: hypothetical protein [Stenotrophomonas]OEZ02442.1 hypothetical protein BIY45_01170 [Stenotrophomonas sp. BIIR7]
MSSIHAYPAVHGNLLVLEDDLDLAPLLKEVLVMAGYDVHLVRTVRDAKAQIGRGALAAAVLDWGIFGGNAKEFADELRTARVPYVFASASNPSELSADHRWAPFFSKPYPITALINAVEESRLSGVPMPG